MAKITIFLFALLILCTTSLVAAVSELALVFTDGPDTTHTKRILDTLKSRNAKATFLFKASLLNTAEKRSLALRAKNEGHVVGHIGFAGTDFTAMTAAQLASDLDKANAAVKSATGVAPKFVGFPRSRTNAAVNSTVKEKGLVPVIWNFDSLDWAFPAASGRGTVKANYIYQLEEADPATWSFIVDLHDNTTIALVLPQILDKIKSALNLTPVTMDRCYTGAHPVSSPLSRCSNGQVALTFDDGPVQGLTENVLDVLKTYGVKATFFVIGSYFDGKAAESAIVKRAFSEGHTIASHSYTHPDFLRLTVAQMKIEIEKTSAAIKKVTGTAPQFFRFPYNSYNSLSFQTVKDMGMSVVEWNADPIDWAFASPGNSLYDPTQITTFFSRLFTKRSDTLTIAVNSGITESITVALADVLGVANNAGFSVVTVR